MLPAKRSTNDNRLAHKLSETDIARLLSPEQANAARLDVTRKLADQYQDIRFNDEHAALAEQIFRLLVKDTELSVRVALAETLKTNSSLPRDIVLTMVGDVEQVALPMLEFSEVLSETDLVDLIASTIHTNKHQAIAKRKSVSEKVVDALIDYSEAPEVIATLARNEGALLGEQACQQIIERHGMQTKIMEALACRDTLPATVVEKVIHKVTGELGRMLAQKYHLSEETLQVPANKTREDATLALIRNCTTKDSTLKLLEQLHAHHRLSPSLLIGALTQGNLLFFTLGMGKLAGIPPENAEKLLQDRGGLGFRALFNKSGLPAEYFATLRDLAAQVAALKEEAATLTGEAFAHALLPRVNHLPHLAALVKAGQ